LKPPVYLLNGGRTHPSGNLSELFAQTPAGRTPLTESLQSALEDHDRERPGDTLLILVLADGEASDMQSFNRQLDAIQGGRHGDVQVCIMGLSLVPRDLEWLENEECEDTRVRTAEPFEVELAQMVRKRVVYTGSRYNFAMHTYRILLTNLFPADYDYEAPIQNLRHRFYITWHGKNRRCSQACRCWCLASGCACAICWLVSGGCCCGWLQGNDCGTSRPPDGFECCCENDSETT